MCASRAHNKGEKDIFKNEFARKSCTFKAEGKFHTGAGKNLTKKGKSSPATIRKYGKLGRSGRKKVSGEKHAHEPIEGTQVTDCQSKKKATWGNGGI